MNAHRPASVWVRLIASFAAMAVLQANAQAQATKAPVAPKTQEKAKAKEKAAPKEVDVNSATAEELMELPGVGEAISRKIIETRPHKSVDDLVNAGVPAATLAKIRPMLVARPLPVAVDVNTATAERLETLPGVGPALAKAIIADRPYKTFDDLAKVKGLGPAKLETLRGRVSFGKAPAAATPTPTPAPSPTPATEKPKAVAKEKAAEAKARSEAAKEAMDARPKGKPALAPGQKVDINTATAEELDSLFGIGPVRAQAIIDGRPYKAIEDIKKVKGIKDAEFAKIKDHITVK